MKLTPYKKILGMAKEAIDKTLVPVRAAQAKKQGELEMMKLEEKILTKQTEITELTTSNPLNYDKIISALDDLALLERRQKQFGKIIGELFEEEE